MHANELRMRAGQTIKRWSKASAKAEIGSKTYLHIIGTAKRNICSVNNVYVCMC